MSQSVACWYCGGRVNDREEVCRHCGQRARRTVSAALYPLKVVGVFVVAAAAAVLVYTLVVG